MFKGKTAFITGGSGAVGSAIVRVFAREGCNVTYSYHAHAEAAAQLDAELAGAGWASCSSGSSMPTCR